MYTHMKKRYLRSTTENQTNELYNKLFNDESTLHFHFSIHEHPAFLSINNDLTSLIEDILYLNSILLNKLYVEHRLPYQLIPHLITSTLIEEIYQTNEIESVNSTRREIKEVIQSKTAPQHYKRLFGMINKYQQLQKEEMTIQSCEELRNLYNQTLLKDIANADPKNVPDGIYFRKEQVSIDSGGKEIHRGVMDEQAIINQMNQALFILNDENYSLLIRVALFHYFFAYIHPFYDGNGRLDRLISSLYLKQKLHILCALQLSVSCKKHQSLYYKLFTETNDVRNKGDMTYFVIGFLKILKEGIQELCTTMDTEMVKYRTFEQYIERHYPTNMKNVLTAILQTSLFNIQGISMKHLEEQTQLSSVTIRAILKSENVAPYLLTDKIGKTFYYSLNLDLFMK